MPREWWGMLATGPTEPPPVTGGYKDFVVNLSSSPAPGDTSLNRYANTFLNGTVAGSWVRDGAGAWVSQGAHATWRIDVSGTVSGTGSNFQVMFELNLDPSTQVEIFNGIVGPTDAIPLSYTAHSVVNPSSVALPAAGPGGVSGTITFTFIS